MGTLNASLSYIPLTRSELIDLLCVDRSLTEQEQEQFRTFCDLVTAVYHLEFNRHLQELKRDYAPFDPDVDTTTLLQLSDHEKQNRLNALYRQFAWLLEQANFQHLSREEIEPVVDRSSDWGIRMDVDFSAFEHIAIFARGDTVQTRTRRRWLKFYRLEEAEVPIYRRLVLILKMRRHKRLGGPVDTENVYLKIFKDIPKLDVMMLLPGARVKLTKFDRGRIGLPLLSGLGLIVWQFLQELTQALETIMLSPNAIWGITAGTLGYGYKSYYGYMQTKQAYHLTLTQSLYFQNLDSNAGVLTRLLDEAEEQECRSAILAYYCLWRYAPEEGWSADELDLTMDLFLDRHAEIDLDCTGLDALARLRKLGLVEQSGQSAQRWRAVALPQALQVMQGAWIQRPPAALPTPAVSHSTP
jgi:hypothetical protein